MTRLTPEQYSQKIKELEKLKKEAKREANRQVDRARNHKLIQLGLLFEKHGLFATDHGALAGFLEQYKELITPENPDFKNWKIAGDRLIVDWETNRRNRTGGAID